MLSLKQIGTICLTIFLSVSLCFASGVSPTATTTDCDNETLSTYSGTTNLQANWGPNKINLYWYSDDTLLDVQDSADSCFYDGALTIPDTPPTKTGYTFDGWRVRGLPEGYTKLEYIESTGTQYIYTGIRSNGIGLKTEVIMQLTTDDTAEKAIVGMKTDCYVYEIYFSGASWSGAYHTSGQSTGVRINRTTGVMYTITSEMTSNSITHSVNDVQNSYSGTLTNSSAWTDEIMLFGLCGGYRISARVYSVLIWNNGALVRNFIPAKDSSNVVGLYDLVSKTFFTNAGTGSFVAGPVE